MRIALVGLVVALGASCASAPKSGPLGEGATVHPRITSVDNAFPPRNATIQLNRPEYVALLLIAPGHSATLLYPPDSLTPNQFQPGSHQLGFRIPELLVQTDSSLLLPPRRDSMRLSRPRSTGPRLTPIPDATPTFLLVVTSPQPLHFARIVEKTVGVSIPNIDTEALNAVGKAIKATIANEPRDWAGFYQQIEVRRR